MTRCLWAPGPEPCRRAPLPGMAACAAHLPRAFRAFGPSPEARPGPARDGIPPAVPGSVGPLPARA